MKCPETQTIEISESKELEALDNLAKNVEGSDEYLFIQYKQDYDTIKNALIHKQKLEKAIKLLKNFTLTESFGLNLTLEEFNEAWLLDFTEEEFNLLKEVFGNENILREEKINY